MSDADKDSPLSSLNYILKLDNLEKDAEETTPFDKERYAHTSRLEITKLFLWWYFSLIAGSFLFCYAYNLSVAYLNIKLKQETALPYLEIANTVSLITTTLSSGLGFVIGYYFKNKGE